LFHETNGLRSRSSWRRIKQRRADAHNRWWELYWQAYCATNKRDQELLTRQMNELESLWGIYITENAFEVGSPNGLYAEATRRR